MCPQILKYLVYQMDYLLGFVSLKNKAVEIETKTERRVKMSGKMLNQICDLQV